jgi:hypothetical protein
VCFCCDYAAAKNSQHRFKKGKMSMTRAKHEDFRASRYVSVWLGNFETDAELDAYLDGQFVEDFGFEILPPEGPELAISEEGPVEIPDLIEGFSDWQAFIKPASIAAMEQGWEEATTAVVFYNFCYQPQFINPEASGLLEFIDAFPYGARWTSLNKS